VTGLQLAVGEQMLAAFVLAVARTGAFVLVTPPFNTRAVPTQARVALALALALPLTAAVAPATPALQSWDLVLRLLVQIATGLALGFFVLIAVSAIQAAGDLVDLVGGFNSSIALDPLMLTQTSVFGRLHQFVAVTVLFATDGHLMVVHGLSRSLQAMPDPSVSWDALGRALIGDVGGLVLAALQIAAPIIGAMLVADVSLGLMTRAAPALNAFSLAFPVKILFTLLLVGFVIVRLPSELHDLVQHATLAVLQLSGAGG
jgi:flagellar biosynthetic protein FliR